MSNSVFMPFEKITE